MTGWQLLGVFVTGIPFYIIFGTLWYYEGVKKAALYSSVIFVGALVLSTALTVGGALIDGTLP